MRALNTLAALPLLLCWSAAASADDALTRARAVEQDLVQLIERVSKAYVLIGGGSGIVVSPDGLVLTNHHVAGSRPIGEDWQVMLPGSRFDTAKMIGTDARGDISLLKLQGPGPYDYVEMADSDQVVTGQAVVALGNPFGFSKDGTPHVTIGVVSTVHRLQGGYSDAIQTDAPLNPGNSGGPLLDMEGRLIGINGKIAVRWGNRASSGVGFAIPTNQIRSFIPQFQARGKVDHGTIPGLNLDNTRQGGDGALVRRLTANSPAAQSGLRQGDLIVAADGRPVHSAQRFWGIAGTLPEGSPLPIKVKRGNEELTLTLQLQTREEAGETRQGQPTGGFLGVRMSNADGGGVELEEVVTDSPAARAGLQAGDVVRGGSVGGKAQPFANTADLVKLLGTLKPGAKLVLQVRRAEADLEVTVTLGEPPR